MVFETLPEAYRLPAALGAIAALVAASAFLTASESAILSFPRARRREERAERAKDARAARVERLVEHPHDVLLTTLVGTTILDVAAAVLAALVVLERWPGLGGLWIALLVGVLSLVLLTFASVLPRAVASRHAESWSLVTVGAFAAVSFVLRPLVALYRGFSGSLSRLASGHESQPGAFVSEQELKTLVTAGAEEGILEEQEQEMIHSVLEFGETTAREVMLPRGDVVAVPADATLDHVRAFVLDAGYSRMPVYQGSLDNIVGVLLVKDMLVRLVEGKGGAQVREVMHDPLFVPETMRLDALLKEMREKRVHLAIVVDEFGGVSGILTLEDLIEEIVGDISDEYDLRSEPIRRLDERTAVVDARTHVEDVNEALGTAIPEDGPYDTVGGFVFHRLGRIGREGEVVQGKDFDVVVDKVLHRRILRVRIRTAEKAAPGEAAEKA